MTDSGCCEESISTYLDGELSNIEVSALETHLQTCPGCRKKLSRLQKLSSAVRQVPRPAVSPLLAKRVQCQIQTLGVYSEGPLIRLLGSWGMLSLFALGALAILFGPVALGMLYIIIKHLAIVTSLVVKLSWQLPLIKTKLAQGLIYISGAIIAFYGFGRVYSTSGKGLI